MESVLYRAKRKDNGEWVKGYYAKIKHYKDLRNEEKLHVIFPLEEFTLYPNGELSDYHEIIPETLGRLIGYACYDSFQEVDEMFTNDIIGVWKRHCDANHTDPESIALVLDEHSISVAGLGRYFPQDTTQIRILGNAYDNPELLHGHNMNHFINGINEYPGTWNEYHKKHEYLTNTYDIHGAHARCYMCNFENDYICHRYNGGCKLIKTCRKIREEEISSPQVTNDILKE